LAQKLQIPTFIKAAHYGMGEILESLGELHESRVHLEQAIRLAEPQKRRPRIYDIQLASLATAAETLWALGYPDQALERIQQSLTLAQELSHPFSLAFALNCAAGVYQRRRDVEATEQYAQALIELSHEQGFTLREARGVILRGWALSQRGLKEEGIVQIRQAMATIEGTGAELWWPNFVALLVEARSEAKQPDEDLRALNEALDSVRRTGAHVYQPELLRLRGELRMRGGFGGEAIFETAEQDFRTAIDAARTMSAKSDELRCTTSLARMLAQQARHGEARTMLADVYGWFTEGFDTGDLREAKLLLDELNQ